MGGIRVNSLASGLVLWACDDSSARLESGSVFLEGDKITGAANLGNWPGDAPISNGKIDGDIISSVTGVFERVSQAEVRRIGPWWGRGCLRTHPTSNAICATGRQFLDWSADYRLFSRSPWDPHALFDPLFDHLAALLPSPQAPVIAALEDTLCKKTGRHIPGATYAGDPMSPPFPVNLVRGLRFVQASVLVRATPFRGPARALPVRFEPAPPAVKPPSLKDARKHSRKDQRNQTKNQKKNAQKEDPGPSQQPENRRQPRRK